MAAQHHDATLNEDGPYTTPLDSAIADLCLAEAGVRTIATRIGRSPSTVSRKLRRNGPQPGPRPEEYPRLMRPRSEPSCAGAGPKPVSSTTRNWHPGCRRSCV